MSVVAVAVLSNQVIGSLEESVGLFDSSQKEFLTQFRSGDWRSEVERKESVAAIRAGGKLPVKNMIQVIGSLHPSETSKERVRSRMMCLEEILEGVKDPTIVSPMLDLLPKVDAVSREFLIRILKNLYQKEQSEYFVEYLKSGQKEIREAMSEVLGAVGGKTAFDIIRRKIQTDNFPSYAEAAEAICRIAGHHSIQTLKEIIEKKGKDDRLKALDLLANPEYMKIRQRRALETAFEFIGDPDEQIRGKVIALIGEFGEKDDAPALLPLLQKEEKRNLQAVVDALGNLANMDVLPSLIALMDSNHAGIKLSVINALGKFENEQCIEPLIEALRDRNIMIRQRTIEVLGTLGRSESVRLGKLLISMMKDRDVNIRRSVVEVMRLVGEKDDIWWKLIRYLRDEDWWVRERITEILAELGGPKILEPIVSLLDDPSEIVRRYAIEVLVRLGDRRAAEYILRCLKDNDWWVRERAVEALGEIGDPRVVPVLNALLDKGGEDLLWTVIQTLQKFAHASSYIPFLKRLDHPLPDYRIEIIRALDKIGGERIIDTLEAVMNDEDKRVRDFVTSLLPKYNLSPTEMGRRSFEHITPALLDQMLLEVKSRNGEDMFIIAGNRPMLKIRGDVEVLDDHVFTPPETRKLLMDVMSPIQREQFEDMEDIDMSYIIRNEGSRFRVNIYKTRTGISAVFRVINQEIIRIEDLGLPQPIVDFTQLKQGLVLVTGPTGSGKSTTLAAMIDYMNRTRTDHVVTIEDPIEYVHKNNQCIINQREVGAHTKSFSNALRGALREDPDIILVGEMRDLETISIAITAAETGHLVLGTLHTISAAKTVDRIIDVFPGRQQAQVRAMLSESLRGVLSQQLMKRKDTDGRILALELMICNDAIANLIRKEKIYQIPSILTTHYEQGMTLMDNELMRLVKEGKIYPEDAFVKSINKKEFEQFLQSEGIGGF
ncbi:PilT/PilU family type 4a pilus ATPase [bacterium]|nr:PilT/PilU family type 4a pilus ATPase [candidate division CSSED10-310 bacterium]